MASMELFSHGSKCDLYIAFLFHLAVPSTAWTHVVLTQVPGCCPLLGEHYPEEAP